jgi:hypothetical protein
MGKRVSTPARPYVPVLHELREAINRLPKHRRRLLLRQLRQPKAQIGMDRPQGQRVE